jgi:hypothetical protein
MLLTGVGPHRAARSLEMRLAHGLRPDLIVSSGFAGALSPALALSSWIAGARIGEWNGVEAVPVQDVALVKGPPGVARCEVRSSSELVLVAGAMPVADAREPVVVDMESAALARVAARWGIAFAVVRLISDTPAHPLPRFSAAFASAMAATTNGSRLSLAGRGLFGAIADPPGVLRLVRQGTACLRELEAGWQRLAAWSSAHSASPA